MVTFFPIFQRGCRRASATVFVPISETGVLKNGPPEAVRMTRLRPARGSLARHWKTPLCSLSTGMISAPLAAASAWSSAPATTSDSLLARATRPPAADGGQRRPQPLEPRDGGDDDIIIRGAGDFLGALGAEDDAHGRAARQAPPEIIGGFPALHGDDLRGELFHLLGEQGRVGAGGQPDHPEPSPELVGQLECADADRTGGPEDRYLLHFQKYRMR